ncbi:MAG: hypothetical protein U0325_29885 [Polyangiales bacterium]
MSVVRALSQLLAPLLAALLCALPWLAPSLGSTFDGLDLALPGVVTAAGLVATLWAAARSDAPRPFDPLRWSVTLPLLTLIAVVPIVVAWRSARSNGTFLAGVIPYSDAGDYVQGALKLLAGGALEPWSCRRPLNAALLATRLAAVDLSVERALVLQALLLAVAATLGARAVALDRGHRAGLTVGAGVMIFGAIYTPTTLSEALGLTLGALALALLWHAARTRIAWHHGLGMAALTVALNARSGPFFALATLLAWTLWDGRRARGEALARGGAAVAGVALAFGYNRALLAVHHGAAAGMHGNFSYTLWGLASGGLTWDQAYVRYPEVLGMTDPQAAAFLYDRAFEAMRAHPTDLLRGLWANVYALVSMVIGPLTSGRLQARPALATALFVALLSPAAWFTRRALQRRPDDPTLRLTLAATLGLALSVPVIFLDGLVRVFAAGFPLAVAFVVAVAAARRGGPGADASVHREAMRAPAALFAALLTLAVVAPRVARRHPSAQTPTCGPGERPFALWTEGRPLWRRIVEGGWAASEGRVPVDTLHARIARDPNLGFTALDTQLWGLGPGDTVYAGLDLRAGALEYFVFPRGMAPSPRRVVRGCAARPSREFRQFRRVRRWR